MEKISVSVQDEEIICSTGSLIKTAWLPAKKRRFRRLTSPEDSEKKQLVLKSWTRVHAGT